MEIYELPNIEFLDVYPSKPKKINIPFKLVLLFLNIILLFGGIVYSWNNLTVKTSAAPVEKPFLYEKISGYSLGNTMVFKGDIANNYVKFNDMIWRILKVNSSGTITLILDDAINQTPWQIGSDFEIINYLNTNFLEKLDKSKLVANKVCNDNINNLNNLTCTNISSEYVTLLDVNSFISTQEKEKSFIINGSQKMWLINAFDESNHWHTVGSKISYSIDNSIYDIKPVITLSNEIVIDRGNGTIDNPYYIKSSKITLGSSVKLASDLYQVYDMDENSIKLMLDNTLETKYIFQGNYEKLLNELETNFYENLPYKDLLEETNWSKENIKKNKISYDKVSSKVGIPTLLDFKFNNSIQDYYTLTNLNSYILVSNIPIIYGTKSNEHAIRPTIAISKTTAEKLVNKNGIYIMEDK